MWNTTLRAVASRERSLTHLTPVGQFLRAAFGIGEQDPPCALTARVAQDIDSIARGARSGNDGVSGPVGRSSNRAIVRPCPTLRENANDGSSGSSCSSAGETPAATLRSRFGAQAATLRSRFGTASEVRV